MNRGKKESSRPIPSMTHPRDGFEMDKRKVNGMMRGLVNEGSRK